REALLPHRRGQPDHRREALRAALLGVRVPLHVAAEVALAAAPLPPPRHRPDPAGEEAPLRAALHDRGRAQEAARDGRRPRARHRLARRRDRPPLALPPDPRRAARDPGPARRGDGARARGLREPQTGSGATDSPHTSSQSSSAAAAQVAIAARVVKSSAWRTATTPAQSTQRLAP